MYRWCLWLRGLGRGGVCRRSLARTASSNPAGGMDVCLLLVLCVAWSTESYRVWCVQLSVTQKPQPWEGLGPLGLSSQRGTSVYTKPSNFASTNPPATFMKVYSLPIQNYVCLQKQVYACMRRKFFSACASKTGNVHIKATQRRARLSIAAVEKQ